MGDLPPDTVIAKVWRWDEETGRTVLVPLTVAEMDAEIAQRREIDRLWREAAVRPFRCVAEPAWPDSMDTEATRHPADDAGPHWTPGSGGDRG